MVLDGGGEGDVVLAAVDGGGHGRGAVEPERLLEKFGGQPQTMKVTYYPPCRQAGDVLGLSPHTDACAVTLLLHVNDVQGLQIRRDDGKWHAVEPLEGAFIVNVGDTLEASTVTLGPNI